MTPETALTVTNCKLTLMVDDANVPTLVLDTNPTASGGSNDMVHVTGDDAGFYDLELAAANVNYLGRAMLALTDAANHCPVFHEFMIIPAPVYDSLFLGTDRFDVNVTHVADTAQTARDIGAAVPAAVPGAAGGLFIAGTNAATTVTTSFTTTFTGNLTGSVGSVASGGITEASFATTAGSFAPLGVVDQGTAQSASGTGLVLRAAAAFADDTLIGGVAMVFGSDQGYWQAREITDNALSGDAVTIDPAWTATPTGTITYKLFAGPTALTAPPDVNVEQWNNVSVTGMPMPTYTQPTGFLAATFPGGTVANTTNITAGTVTTVTNLTNAPTAGDFTATMKTSIGTAVAASAVASVTSPVTVGTNSDKTGYALTSAYDFAKGTVAVTESYSADGAAPTPVQALMLIMQMLTEKSITSTTLTVKKLDGSTTAATFTLNSASTPTAVTRAT